MIFDAINFLTGERTTFRLLGSHTSTARIGQQPARKLGCAGCNTLREEAQAA